MSLRHVPGDLVSGSCEHIYLEQLHSGAWLLAVYTGEGAPHLFDFQADGPIRLIAVDTSTDGGTTPDAFRAFLRRAAADVATW